MMQMPQPPSAAAEAILRTIERANPAMRYRTEEAEPAFDLAAYLRARHQRQPLPERELSAINIWSRASGEIGGAGERAYIGWGALAQYRTMSAQPGSKGGYAIGTEVGPMVDALLGPSIAIALGAATMSGLVDDVTLPSEGDASGGAWWVAPAAAPSADADLVVGQLSATPRVGIGRVDVSEQLMKQSNASAAVGRAILRKLGYLIDTAVIAGPGGAAPLGLMNVPGTTPQSGTSLSWAGVRAMRKASLNAGADEASLVWLASPDAQEVLTGREKSTGSGFIWADGKIDGIKAVSTKRVPNGTLLLVPMDAITIASWGAGPTVEVGRPVGGLEALKLALRVMGFFDVVVGNPGAVSITRSVT